MPRVLISALVLWFAFTSPVSAQKLLLEGITAEPPNTLEGIPRPNRGMTAERVKQVFGVPRAKSDSVGSPPITRWVYDRFIVVFEGDRVIHSVVKKPAYTDLNN